ncbi:DUF2975 domain-containing protein [Nocardioides gilvus]|uniref:DUF2975 domain-containing protein n=1 Tax=Nocardioides gilvus TaxID=1735589 RepID=UPI000D74CBBB|nr:DUF2975 domain-containing protein [Nocardioides gilvus]
MNATLTKLLTFDRVDHWGVRILVWLTVAGTAFVTVVRPLLHWAWGNPLVGEINVDPARAGAPSFEARDGATLTWSGELWVELASPTAIDRLTALAPGVVLTTVVAVLAHLVLALMRGVEVGRPFSATNVRRLRLIAATLLGSMVLMPVTNALREAMYASSALVDVEDAMLILSPLSFLTLGIAALVVAALAEAFSRGSRLEHDVDGLV